MKKARAMAVLVIVAALVCAAFAISKNSAEKKKTDDSAEIWNHAGKYKKCYQNRRKCMQNPGKRFKNSRKCAGSSGKRYHTGEK